jgi:hypothetical protein
MAEEISAFEEEFATSLKATLEMCDSERQSAVEAAVRQVHMNYEITANQAKLDNGKSLDLLAVEEECASALRATLEMCESERLRAVDAAVRNVRLSYEKAARETEMRHAEQVSELQREMESKDGAFRTALQLEQSSTQRTILERDQALNSAMKEKEEQHAEALASKEVQLEAEYLAGLTRKEKDCEEMLKVAVAAKEEASQEAASSHAQGMAVELHAWEERTEMTVQHVLTKAYETVQQV